MKLIKKSKSVTDRQTDGRMDGQSGVQSRVHATKKRMRKLSIVNHLRWWKTDSFDETNRIALGSIAKGFFCLYIRSSIRYA